MKLIAWNCNMVYRKKAGLITSLQPDIVVVPECEEPGRLQFDTGIPLPNDMLWYGLNKHKGLGIFSYSDYRLKLSKKHNPEFRTILPVIVSNPTSQFTLLAVWANNPSDPKNQYVGQVWKAIHYYSRILKSSRTLLAGDFNSNTIWDKPRRAGNHSDVVAWLQKKKIHSVYHHFHKQEHGKEQHNTLYLYRHKNKPYHIDYCFASGDFIGRVAEVQIGDHAGWCRHSDHTPVIVNFND